MDNQSEEKEAIPSWLETPSDQTVLPPVETTVQELPIEQLSWENFERLCLRLARTEADIESCRLYGKKGEKQGGIDFFSRVESSDKYKVYQCKRVRNFDQTKIKEAVTKFLEGDWAEKTEIFFLCTSDSLKSIKKSKEFLKQQENLEKKGIHLKVLDKDELSIMLKKAPEIVNDFFGRQWVREFCGVEKAEALGERLDASQVIEFRKRFSTLYKYVFNRNDPGLPGESGDANRPLTIEQRYIIPDIYERRDISMATSEGSIELDSQTETQGKSLERDPLESVPKTTETRDSISYTNISYQQRIPIEEWLRRRSRSIVLGEPGSGKSSLLRFVAIDLLQDEPSLSILASKWGQFLPVWVPFALWTKKISNPSSSECSLSDLLESMLNGFGEKELCELVKQALKDERLLLLVDGLDEWTDESAVTIALNKFQYFINTKNNIPVIMTSRPRGFEQLGFPTHDWQIGTLSDFSLDQQEQFSRNWFSYWAKEVIKGCDGQQTMDRQIEQQVEGFLAELQRSSHLKELAKVPLLLGLLISLKLHQVRLPENRFKAYDLIINYLISAHPRKRREAASLTEPTIMLPDEDKKDIFSYLAYQIQTQFPEGLIEHEQAKALIEDFLEDDKGLIPFEARKYFNSVLDSGERELGILVEKSSGELGFYHRTFQEYLAAYYLYTLPLDKQQKIVSSRSADPQWFDIILSLFFLTRRPDDLKSLIDSIRNRNPDPLEKFSIQRLLSEVAFGDFKCPHTLANELAQEAFKEIEFGYWMPHRERILRVALSGLRSFPMRSLVQEKLRGWFPSRSSWREGIFKAIAKWPKDSEVIECLFRGIHDEETINRRAAAKALAELANGDPEVGNRLADIAWNAPGDNVRTAAIESLLNGWPEHLKLNDILEEATKSTSTILQLIGTKGRVQKGIQTNDDLERLMRLGASNAILDFNWDDDFAQILIQGWSGSPKVKRICLRSVIRDGWRQETLDNDLALRILLKGYPQDDEVAQFCADQLRNEIYPFSGMFFDFLKGWDLLARNFKGHPLLTAAIDEWVPKQEYRDMEISKAALVGCTPKTKEILLEKLNTSSLFFWHAQALLDGWGMEDSDVAQALNKIAYGKPGKAANIGFLLPKIIPNRDKCRKRLLELLSSPKCHRLDFVIRGLANLGIDKRDKEILTALIKLIPNIEKNIFPHETIGFLIQFFPLDLKVRELAKGELIRREGNYSAVASSYPEDPEIRNDIFKLATPLPTYLRRIIAEYLGEPGIEDETAMSILDLYDHEFDASVKTQTSINYHNRLKKSANNLDKVIDRLAQGIVSYGHDYEARRHAAFCGLVSLERLDVMLNVNETIGESKPVSISLREDFFSSNIPLVRHILENWDYINQVFGTSFWKRISKSEAPTKDLWSIFCMFASDYPQVSNQVLLFLETNNDVRPTSEILHFLERVKPGSPLLLKYCLKTFEREFPNRDSYSRETTIAAAGILGTQFRGNQEVLDKIDLGKRYFYEYDILTLCEGWSDSKILDDLFKHLNANRGEIREGMEPAFLHLACLNGDSKLVFDELTRIIAESSPYISSEKNIIARPLINRIKKDDELWRILLEHLNGTPSVSDKASIPRLMIKARGVSSELRDWCIEEVKKQLDGSKPPEFGLDLVSGQNRAVVSSILDELDMQNYSSVPTTIKQTTDTSMISLH